MPTLRLSALAALAIAAAFLPGLARADDGIVVYNAQHQALTEAWADGFTKDTGIKVTLRNGDDTELGNQLVQEGAASPADVFLTENSPAMALVDNAGLFESVDAATLAQVPATFKAADGKWIGIAARSTVFAYDTRKLKEADLPQSLLDLAHQDGGLLHARLRLDEFDVVGHHVGNTQMFGGQVRHQALGAARQP